MLEAGIWVEDIRPACSQRGIDFEFHGLREFLNSAPPGRAVNQSLWPEDHRNPPVSELIEVLQRHAAAGFVVHHHEADTMAENFPADRDRGDFGLVQIR